MDENKGKENNNNDAPDIEDIINPFIDPTEQKPDANKEQKKEEDADGDDEIRNTINKEIGPIREKIEQSERKLEIDNFFQTELGSHLKPYESKIKEFALDKRSRHMKVEAIAAAIAGKALLNIGAKMGVDGKKKADASSTAAKSATTPSGGGDGSDIPDVSSLSKTDFSNLVEGIKSGTIKFKK